MIVAREKNRYYSLTETVPAAQPRPQTGWSRQQKAVAVLLLLGSFLLGLLTVYVSYLTIATSWRLSSLQAELALLRREQMALAGEAASLQQLNRIEHLAVTRLRMEKPRDEKTIVIRQEPEQERTAAVPQRELQPQQNRSWVMGAIMRALTHLEHGRES